MITQNTLSELHGSDLPTVRRYVRGMLEATPSFRGLDPSDRRNLAGSMVKVLSYLTDPAAGQRALAPVAERQALARGLDTQQQKLQDTKARDALQQRLAEKPGQVGNEMKGQVAGQSGGIMKQLVAAVDFPQFVSSLIEGVFTSIVNSSIKQMHEFAKYLNAVAMTLQDFAAENSNIDEGRDYLASRNPRTLRTERGSDGRKRLRIAEGVADEDLPDFRAMFGLTEDIDLEDDEAEAKVAESAQLQLARMRQQQLATMVLMGINRIVVTEGEIKATVQFEVTGVESAARTAEASSDDTQSHSDYEREYEYQRKRSFWGTEASGSGSSSSAINTRVSTAHARTEDNSDARLESKAKLTGFVQVKFKSETFPLERLASSTEMTAVQERAAR